MVYTKRKKIGVDADENIQNVVCRNSARRACARFPLIDGIIINQENSHRMWILEMFIDKEHQSIFEKWMADEELLEVKVVISYPENEPAAFRVAVKGVKLIGDKYLRIIERPIEASTCAICRTAIGRIDWRRAWRATICYVVSSQICALARV